MPFSISFFSCSEASAKRFSSYSVMAPNSDTDWTPLRPKVTLEEKYGKSVMLDFTYAHSSVGVPARLARLHHRSVHQRKPLRALHCLCRLSHPPPQCHHSGFARPMAEWNPQAIGLQWDPEKTKAGWSCQHDH